MPVCTPIRVPVAHPLLPAPLSGDPPTAKLNYTDEYDAPIMAGSGGVLSAGKRAKHGSNVSLIAQLDPPAPSSRPPGRRYAHR